MPGKLESLTATAIKNAEKIAQQIERDQLDKYSNPCCSDLPELITILLNLKPTHS